MAYRTFVSARAVLEATRGAGGTPVRVLTFTDTAMPNLNREILVPEEYRGTYFPNYQAAVGTTRPEFQFSGLLDYSQAAWFGATFIKGSVTGTGSTSITYAYKPSGGTDDLQTAKLEVGYEGLAAATPGYNLAYMGGEELTIRWDKSSSEVTFDARFVGGTAAAQLTAYTGTPSSPTTALVTAANTEVYIDSTTIGTTKDANVQSVEWTLTNGWKQLMTLNTSAGPQAVMRPSHRKWTLRVRRYFANKTEWDASEAATTRKIRVVSVGPTLGSSTYKLTADYYAVVTSRSHTFVDDLVFEELELAPLYDTASTADFSWTVIAADASIT